MTTVDAVRGVGVRLVGDPPRGAERAKGAENAMHVVFIRPVGGVDDDNPCASGRSGAG